MVVRRIISGVILAGLAAPLLAAAPRAHEARPPRETIPAPPAAMTTRVFARADAEPSPPPPAASEEPLPHPPAVSTPSPEIAARARAELEANRNGKIDRAHYTADMNERITEAGLAELSTALKALGAVKSFVQVRRVSQGAVTLYVFRVEFEKPPVVEEAIAWNAAGKVDFLQFGPAAR